MRLFNIYHTAKRLISLSLSLTILWTFTGCALHSDAQKDIFDLVEKNYDIILKACEESDLDTLSSIKGISRAELLPRLERPPQPQGRCVHSRPRYGEARGELEGAGSCVDVRFFLSRLGRRVNSGLVPCGKSRGLSEICRAIWRTCRCELLLL